MGCFMNSISYTSAGQLPIKLLQCKNAIVNGKIVPYHLQLIPTNRCNGNCPWCSCAKVDRSQELSFSEIRDLLFYFGQLGTKAITITGGGEPTIHKSYEDIISMCEQLKFKVGMTTNGLLLENNFHKITNEVLTWLRLSIIDDNPIDRIINISEGLPDVKIGISFTVPETVNIKLAEEICKIIHLIKNITHIRFVQDILNPIDLSMQVIESKCKRLTNKAIFQYRSKFSCGTEKCLISLLKPLVGADGYIYPCCGVQYATKEDRLLPLKFRMCHWSKFHKTTHFNGSICKKCYYEKYNNYLEVLTMPLEHEDFL